jgi:putative membrane protein
MDAAELARLLWGTVRYRPYVYAFLVCFLAFGIYQAGWRRTVAFALPTWVLAFLAEFSSTRNGFPFGPYSYFDATRGRELWISNVPFWDSVSFVFLSWFSLVLAAAARTPAPQRRAGPWPALRSPATPLLGGLLMMLLDVVIDPVTLQGEKWFLGRIYEYPADGFYFGVTAANFAGWFLVGAVTQWTFQGLLAVLGWWRGPWRHPSPLLAWGAYAVYAGVLGFMLAVTVSIGDHRLALASAAVSAVTLGALAWGLRRSAPAPAASPEPA